MSVNTLDFNQCSTLLNAIVKQATGETSTIAPIDETQFITVGQVALKTGYDKLATAISQVVGKTIFSVRPYARKFKNLNVSEQRYGGITRKLAVIDKPVHDDEKFDLVDGQSVDMYKVNKPQVLQLNFYGANEFEDYITIYTEQLDAAFTSSGAFGEFISMVMQNMSDKIEKYHEECARQLLINTIAGRIAEGDANRVRHVLTEYNAVTGLNLTATTVMQPANFEAFVRWLNAEVATISDKLTERSMLYHTNITGKILQKHTPVRDQRIFMYKPFQEQIKSMAMSGLYNDSYIKLADFEGVGYWQNISDPMSIKAKPVYLDAADGDLVEAVDAVTSTKVLGLIMDVDAAGYTTVKHTVATTPLNAAGLYYNQYYHFTDQFWNAFEENSVVLLLD